ncbi:unnamed protein product [Prunus armeniaca]
MSDSESFSEREPNAFDEESSDGLFDSDGEAAGPDAEGGSDTDVPLSIVYSDGPLSIVYSDGRHVGLGMPGEASGSRQSETSTSGREESVANPPSGPRVSVVYPSNPRMPMGVPKENLFGVDYLGPNKITDREIAKLRAEYRIPDSVRMRIPGPTESLSAPKDGEVVFFTDVLVQGVRLPLQPAVQRILAQIGYAPGQFNPNFWVALMGVITAFGMAGEGSPSYEQFSHLYSVTKSKCADHGGWVQANCLRAADRGHFVSWVPTSQKSWRNRRVLLSGDWESPSGQPARFRIPTTFQMAGKLKQPIATQAEIQQVERVRRKVPAEERVYPQFLFTTNLIRAQLIDPAEMTEDRRAAEAKRMNESFKRRLMMGFQGKKKKTQPQGSAPVDPEDQTLADGLRELNAESAQAGAAAAGPFPRRGAPTEGASSRAAGKRPFTVDLDAEPAPKRGRQAEPARAIFAAENDEEPADLVTLACPSKTVQFANHMIIGSQMELSEIEELPKKLLREEAGRAFRLKASASMDMWLCMKRAINAAEKAKKAYDDGRARVAEAGKAIQDHANLVKDLQAAERQVKVYESKFADLSSALESAQLSAKEALEAKEAVAVALEESERAKASEIEAAVQEAIQKYRHSTKFSALLDKEVGSEMVDLIYRFKRYNPGTKLNLNFIADPPPLPEGVTEEMIEEYEGEDAPEETEVAGAEGADAEGPSS